MEGETVRAKWCILAVVVRGKNKKKKERKIVGKKVEKEKISCLAKNRHAFEKR